MDGGIVTLRCRVVEDKKVKVRKKCWKKFNSILRNKKKEREKQFKMREKMLEIGG